MRPYEFLEHLARQAVEPSPEHRESLIGIRNFVLQKLEHDGLANLVFICTHNSRRSHFGQIWAQTIADYLALPGLRCYSGGTEATALAKGTREALERAGFLINPLTTGDNPLYSLKAKENAAPTLAFSKVYDHPWNPQSGFAAVMTCSDADANCPHIPKAERFALPFEDPKVSDGSPQEAQSYDATSRAIATELLWCLKGVK